MQDEDDRLTRLQRALGMDSEPTLPGVVPPEPEQHRLPGMERQAEAAPERTDGDAQFLRDEDRTRPMPRPTPSMPGMGFYVGPVHPMQTGGFDRLAWGAGRTALPEPSLPTPPQATPDIADGSPLGRLMGALSDDRTPPQGPQEGPGRSQQDQEAAPAIEATAGEELRQGDPGTLSQEAAEAARAHERPGTVLEQARDRLAELMERIDPGHAEREAAMTPDERAQQIEAQLQASRHGMEAGRGL